MKIFVKVIHFSLRCSTNWLLRQKMGEISKIIKKADINQVLLYLQILAKYKGCTEGVNSKSILKKIQLQVDLMSFIFHVLLVGFSH